MLYTACKRMRSMPNKKIMQTVEKAAGKIVDHYDADHEPITGGDGHPIKPFQPAASVSCLRVTWPVSGQ